MTVAARQFVLATGASPVVPAIAGLELVRHHFPADLPRLGLPPKLVILGGDAIAVEIAQALRRLGSEIALLTSGPALDGVDPDFARILLAQLEREGVVLRENVQFERIEPKGDGLQLYLSGGGAIDGSHLLVAAGHRPNVEGLGLDIAGIAFDRDGVKVGTDLRSTTNRRVLALGDVTGASHYPAEHLAGRVLRAALSRRRLPAEAQAAPCLVRGDPEIAWAGLTEAEARSRHGQILVLRSPFAATERARIDDRAQGHVKLIADRSGKVLGAGVVAKGAGEMILPWLLAIAKGANAADFAGLPIPAATRSAAIRRLAITFLLRGSKSPWLARILAFTRRFK